MHASSALGCLLAITLASSLARSVAEDVKLGSIWGESHVPRVALGAFRLVSELHSPGLGTYTIEESALASEQVFRMDMARLDGSTLQGRCSLISRAKSGPPSSWFFKPFKCKQFAVSELAQVLGGELASKFPQSTGLDNFVLAGLSAIWLWAERQPKRQQFAPASSGQEAGALATRLVLNAYDRITVTRDEQFAYDAVFYFEPCLDFKRLPESLVAVHLVERTTTAPSKVVLRARVVQADTQNALELRRQSDLFELPIGFGCAQSHSSAGLVAADQALSACLSAQLATARQCQLEVSSLSPSSPKALHSDISKWRSQQSSFTFTAGPLEPPNQEGDVKASLAVAQLISRPQLTSTGVVRSTRIKRVWLSVLSSQSLYLELDERAPGRNKCRAAQHAHLATKPIFQVEFFEPVGQFGAPKRIVGGLALGSSQFDLLFGASQSFHQIREITDTRLSSREVIQEQRLNSFALFDETGQRVWNGPVSIVRRFLLLPDIAISAAKRNLLPFDMRQLRTSILLLSADERQLLARIHLTLSPGRANIDQAHLHRALDVGACLSELLEDPNRERSLLKVAKHDRISFSINFPVEFVEKSSDKTSSEETMDHHNLEELEEILLLDLGLRQEIYAKFLTNLQALSESTGSKLGPLQVSNVQIDTSKQVVNIAATVHKWPQVLGFVERRASRIDAPKASLSILRELKSSGESCAESCDHYNCLAFQFCQVEDASSCDLLLGEKSRSDAQIMQALTFIPDQKCDFYSRPPNSNHDQEFITPLRLLSILSEAVSRQSDESEKLEIKLQHGDTDIILRPSSVETDFKTMAKSVDHQDTAALSDQVNETEEESLIEPEYEIIFEGRKFDEQHKLSQDFPVQEASQVSSIDECQKFCDENDCRSFSYCKDIKVCMLSQLHQTGEIESKSFARFFCQILSRDYLSKFHKLSSKLNIEPDKISDWKPIESDTSISFDRDCAIKCMNSNKCRSFLYCQSKAQDQSESTSCNLFEQRNNINLIPATSLDAKPEEKTSKSISECSFFRRSYLVDFHKYHAKRLPSRPETQITLLTQGFDAENCATQCVNLNDSGFSCTAFHVCLDTDSSKIPRLTCAVTSSGQLGADDLAEAQKCTSFLPIKQTRIVTDDDKRTRTRDLDGHDKEVDSSSWFSTSLTLLAGSGIGYSVAWILAKLGFLSKVPACK